MIDRALGMSEAVLIPPPGAPLRRAEYLELAASIGSQMPPGLRPVKFAVLATFTVDMLRPYLVVEAARRGMALTWWSGPYGQIEQQIVDHASALYREEPEAVLLLLRLADVAADERFLGLGKEGQARERERLQEWLARQVTTLRARTGALVLVSNFAPPELLTAGIADGGQQDGQAAWVQGVNSDLARMCADVPRAFVLDVARAAVEVGLSRWRDDRLAHLAKAPLSGDALASLAKLTARALRAAAIPPRKCLVLDMDNTIWGGVVGEAGLEGIALGPDYPGSVFVELQRRILGLRDRGILLAAASKNNAEDVEAVLASHPSCLLKREHFAAFEVHWEDKATSLRRIAHALNIGLDAMVLLDDSPVERAWVSDQVPGVAVLDLPDSPMGFWNAIEDSGCFDALTLTSEDKARAGMYALEGKRQSLRGAAATLEEFLGSLELVLTAGKVDQDTLTRVTQLLGKTNQFNLTTRRHDEAAVRSLCESGTGLWVKVRDRFGDSGLVGVVIAVPEDGQSWRIDTLLLSCRVIGRRVETAMLSLLEHAAAARGVRRLIAEFVPTAKNRPAASFLPDHGFIRNGDFWELELDAPRPLPDCFTVEDLTGSLSPARSA